MAANNAAGARSFLHGSVREWIDAVEVVLPDGSLHRVGPDRAPPPAFSDLVDDLAEVLPSIRDGWPRVRKNSSGYALDRFVPGGDPVQLLVGSEGTLGLLTRLRLRLVPEADHRGVTLLALPRLDDLPAAVGAVREAGAVACEYLGRRILEMAGLPDDPEFGSLARGADALLLVEAEGSSGQVESTLEAVSGLARDLGTESREARAPAARERLWDLRHRASPTIEAAADRGLRSMQFIEDCVVPVESLPDWIRGLGSILDRARTDAVVFGHAGDGNLHVNPLVDVEAPDWKARVRTILDETAALIAELGGTLSGEHGDGRIRAPLLDRIWSDDHVAAFRRVKDTLDPDRRLNPGVILPLPGQDPLEGLGAGTRP
jgi:FAD/FMN-containing dehydrogenase